MSTHPTSCVARTQELLSNEMLRTQAPHVDGPEPDGGNRYQLCRSVWELHSNIFQGYGLWLHNVELKHCRTINAAAMLETCSWDSPEAINGLLTELAMYFLVSWLSRLFSDTG